MTLCMNIGFHPPTTAELRLLLAAFVNSAPRLVHLLGVDFIVPEESSLPFLAAAKEVKNRTGQLQKAKCSKTCSLECFTCGSCLYISKGKNHGSTTLMELFDIDEDSIMCTIGGRPYNAANISSSCCCGSGS